MQREAPALRLYRGLLWLYPAEFRDHFTREMCLMLADQLRERPSFASLLLLYFGAVLGAPREHYHMIRQDIVYSLRTMRKQKLTTIAAIVVLALGIGSTTTIFTLVNGLLLRPLPYPEQEQLVYVEEDAPKAGVSAAMAFPNYLDFCAQNHSLQDFALFAAGFMVTLRGDMEAERVPAAAATEPLFRVLGVPPLLGRTFTPEENRQGAPPVVLLSEDLWRRRFGADPGIINKTIELGTPPARVIGVMPHGFRFPGLAEVWLPLTINPARNTRMDHGLQGIARLKSGVSKEQAQEDLRTIMAQITREHPSETYGQTVNVMPYRDRETRRIQPVLFTLLGAVGFVLLIACANITNLLLVRASARTRETALRGALGASRSRLARQFIIEALMLGIGGALAGVLFAWAAVPALLSTVSEQLPPWTNFTPDVRILGFVIAVTVGTGVLVGLVPAFSASRFHLMEALKEGGRSQTERGAKGFLRASLVVAEVAMSVLLLVGAGLMIQTFRNLQGMNAGFRTDDIISLETSAPTNRYPNGPAGVQLVRRLRQELASAPGVISVAGASAAPLLGTWGRSFTVEGWPLLSLKDAPLIHHIVVTPGYFQTLGIPILDGRDFTEMDAKNPLVTIVDAGIAKHYWPNGTAIGKRVRYGPPETNGPWHTVVGVVGEARNQTLRELGRSSVYLPHGEFEFSSINYLVRTSSGLADPANALRAKVTGVDRTIAASRILTLREVVLRSIWQERFFSTVFAFFGALALVLAVVGLYGVMAYTVARRTHEMGIRMALGASTAEIRKMVMMQSGSLVAAGLMLGALSAVFLTKFLKTQLYAVSPGDPATFVAVAVLLAAAGMLASYLPARKATRVDPMLALREE